MSPQPRWPIALQKEEIWTGDRGKTFEERYKGKKGRWKQRLEWSISIPKTASNTRS